MKTIQELVCEVDKTEKEKVIKQIENSLTSLLKNRPNLNSKFVIFTIFKFEKHEPLVLFKEYYDITENVAKSILTEIEENYEIVVEDDNIRGFSNFCLIPKPPCWW